MLDAIKRLKITALNRDFICIKSIPHILDFIYKSSERLAVKNIYLPPEDIIFYNQLYNVYDCQLIKKTYLALSTSDSLSSMFPALTSTNDVGSWHFKGVKGCFLFVRVTTLTSLITGGV